MPIPENLLALALSGLAGAALGLMFFAGLWWTVYRLPGARHPALLVMLSLLLRTALAVTGFYWLMADDLLRLTAALLGFLAVRLVLVRRLPAQVHG